jgi:WhiB family redox-sensing transcriptional regulator
MTSPNDWKDRSECAKYEPDLWWPERPTEGTAHSAVRICCACPVRVECLDHAIARPEREGIWGGLLPHERKRLRYASRVAVA